MIMIIFLYGRDGYRLKQNLEKIVDEYKKKYSGLGYSTLDFNEPGQLAMLEDTVKTVSFFDEKRLIILKDASSQDEKIVELIKTWDLAQDKQRILVFVEERDEVQLAKDKRQFFTVLTIEPNVVKYFEPLEGKQLENWVAKEVKLAGGDIEATAIKKLILLTGQDSWRLGQEIIKLTNYRNSFDDKKIIIADVDLLVYAREDFNIFEIIDAVANKNKFRSAILLNNHIRSGDDPYYIFSMFCYQFRNLLRIKSLIKNAVPYADIVKKTELNPFVVKKTFDQCRKYDLDEMKQLFASLAKTEIEAKSGLIDMEEGLFRFIFSFSN